MYILKSIISLLLIVIFSINLNSQCQVSSVEVTNVECIENATYQFELNLVLSGTTIDSFEVFSNDIFINKYSVSNLPFTIINDKFIGRTNDTLKIVELNDTDCVHYVEVINTCSCSIFDVSQSIVECEEDIYYTYIDFKSIGTSDSFELGHPNQYFGAHLFSELPIKIGPFKKDTTYSIIVSDVDDLFCYEESKIFVDECPVCDIRNISLSSFECDDNYKKYIVLTFDHYNTNTEGFSISLNGDVLDSFEYINNIVIDSVTIRDSIKLGPFELECSEEFTILISDLENPDCNSSNTFDGLCCEKCKITALEIRDKDCTSDSTYNFILDFNFSKNRKDSFKVYNNDKLIAHENISSLPLLFKDFGINGEKDSLSVCMDNGKCCKTISFETPFCDYFDCTISNVSYEIKYDSMGKYWFIITEIEHSNTSDRFNIRGNGINYGNFNYSDVPFTIGEYQCNDSLDLEYEFSDINADNCKFVIEKGIVDCPFKVNNSEINISANWAVYSSKNTVFITSNNKLLNKQIDIYDMLGHKLVSKRITNNISSTSIALGNIKSGIYIVILKDKNNSKFKKVFIQF